MRVPKKERLHRAELLIELRALIGWAQHRPLANPREELTVHLLPAGPQRTVRSAAG